MYLLDTSVLVDLIRTRSERIKKNLRSHAGSTIGVSIITVCELRYGIERICVMQPDGARPSVRARHEDLLTEFLTPLEVFPLDESVPEVYGRIRESLSRTGTPIGPLDTLIAAHALSLDATCVTSNEKEFKRVPGLGVENWAAP